MVLSPLESLAANSFCVLFNYYIINYYIIISCTSSLCVLTNTASSNKTLPDERASASNNFTGVLLESEMNGNFEYTANNTRLYMFTPSRLSGTKLGNKMLSIYLMRCMS